MSRVFMVIVAGLMLASVAQARDHGKLEPVPYSEVEVMGDFWSERLETNRENSLPHVYEKCEETGRISNFARAAGMEEGGYQGAFFNDSDVYKVLEGMAYVLGNGENGSIEKKLNHVIDLIAAAQQDNGYINGWYQLEAPDKKWTNLGVKHELYCAGHLIEAAVAKHIATGDEKLLRVAVDFADLIDELFGPDGKHGVAGHEEIEIALIRLWNLTGDERYLELSQFFVEQRGNDEHRDNLYGTYAQDHKPIRQQEEAVGHCVRAMYLYSAVTDLAAIKDQPGYRKALNRLWDSVVNHKMYVTGGVGVHGHGEGFAEAYYLPNQRAYTETCAAIGMCLWNHRMALLTGNAKYADVFERTLYNGMLSGVSLDGKKFFYTNPLESRGGHHRSPWFGCACCPTNVVRFIPAIAQYMYAVSPENDDIYVTQYAGTKTSVSVKGQDVTLRQRTDYPWDGEIEITVRPESPAEFGLCLRIPDWARGTLDSTELYSFVEPGQQGIKASVNGRSIAVKSIEDGWLRINRRWEDGDTVVLRLPMTIKRVQATDKIKANRGKVALMRGPIVFCLEEVDHDATVLNIALPRDADLTAHYEEGLLEGVVTVTGQGRVHQFVADDDGGVKQQTRSVDIKAVPYYAWDNRTPGEMKVWIPEQARSLEVENPTVALLAEPSASHAHSGDAPTAMNDGILPESSIDHEIPRFTWWAHLGTQEWAQYEWNEPVKLSNAEVYWFDDTGRGQCRIPASWELLYRKDGEWKPVDADKYPVKEDQFCKVDFEPVRTTALRLKVKLQDKFSGGILEWRVSD